MLDILENLEIVLIIYFPDNLRYLILVLIILQKILTL